MPKELYNLGRTVGMSAWEVYVRQSLLLNPDIEPLSEREWLAETIGIGNSLLLKVNKDTVSGVHYRDFELPTNSLLCAPNVIIGSFFFGEAEADSNNWCKKVTDYGPSISNTSSSNPGDGNKKAHNLPTQSMSNVSDVMKKRMMQYIKIQDAIFLQDGTWSNSETTSPAKTFVPDMAQPSMLRIVFQDTINEDFYLLLTGFVNRAIAKGEVGYDMGSVIPDDEGEAGAYRPENGDFLGPKLYPWASKVVLTYPSILTYLIKQGMTSESDNLKIVTNPDEVNTTFKISEIEAGPGIQVNDPSTSADKAKKMTISSRIATENNYVKIVQQTAENTTSTEGDSSKIPTKISGSKATPAAGVGITQPSEPGGDHKIGAKIAVAEGRGKNYLAVSQSAPANADSNATILTPSYAQAETGIGIDDPTVPGQPFKISSKIGVTGDGSNYLKVEQIAGSNSSTQTTTLKPSKAVSGRGVGVSQPSSAGEKFKISAKMTAEGCGKNYLSITQSDNENRSADDISTTLKPTKIGSGKGIAITQPSTPGDDVTISSIIQTSGSAANYLKVDQQAHDSGCGCGCGDGQDASTTSTTITPSKLVEASDESRLVITQPESPAGDIRITTKISFTPHKGISIQDDPKNGVTHIGSVIAIGGNGAKGLDVTQSSVLDTIDEASTTLIVSKHIVDERNKEGYEINDDVKLEADLLEINYPSTSGKDITHYLNIDELCRILFKIGPFKNFMDDLLDKIYGGGTVDDEGHITWPEKSADSKIPVGDLNIYSNDQKGDSYTDCLRSRDGNTENDIRLK